MAQAAYFDVYEMKGWQDGSASKDLLCGGPHEGEGAADPTIIVKWLRWEKLCASTQPLTPSTLEAEAARSLLSLRSNLFSTVGQCQETW